MPGAQEQRCGGLHERGRAAHEHVRVGVGPGARGGEHVRVDAAPAGARVGHRDLHAGRLPPGALGRVELVLLAADRQHEPGVDAGAPREPVTEHRPQRHEPGAARDEEQRPAVLDVPGERAAAGTPQLEAVAGAALGGEPGRDLAVAEALDGQLEVLVIGRAGERVRALGRVAVLGGEADVDALAGAMAGPAGHVEQERADRARLVADFHHLGGDPGAAAPDLGQSSS
jgi:hypothetical protein